MMMALKITADKTALCGTGKMHDIEYPQLRIPENKDCRNDGKIFGDIIGDTESRQRAAGNENLFADFDKIEKFGRIGIEINNIGRFPRCLRAGIHRHGHIGLSQRRRIVCSVTDHRHQMSHP